MTEQSETIARASEIAAEMLRDPMTTAVHNDDGTIGAEYITPEGSRISIGLALDIRYEDDSSEDRADAEALIVAAMGDAVMFRELQGIPLKRGLYRG